jgi:hypothetical protein
VPMFFPTCMFTLLPAPAPGRAVHDTAVFVDHDAVAQSVVPICTEGVGSALPIFIPMTVMLRVEVWAMLPGLRYVITGVSYVKRSSVVPSSPLNVTTTCRRVPTPYSAAWHFS